MSRRLLNRSRSQPAVLVGGAAVLVRAPDDLYDRRYLGLLATIDVEASGSASVTWTESPLPGTVPSMPPPKRLVVLHRRILRYCSPWCVQGMHVPPGRRL